jgi:hypothetical protein
MSLEIRKAQRAKAKLRVGLSGPSGSGKTYSALLLARGLSTNWDKILLIDTENGSGELYSDLGSYNVITLQAPYSPERYIEAIKAGEDAGMETIIIDSVTHEWDGKGGCLELNDTLAKAKFKGNTWSAWSETTPRHQRFIDAIVSSKCHIITAARSKTETVQEGGKVKKLGMKDIQREGFEYELTVAFNIDRDSHMAIASKDRTKLFIDKDPFKLSTKTGEELLAWNDGGVDRETEENKIKIFRLLKMLGHSPKTPDEAKTVIKKLTKFELTPENFSEIVRALEFTVQEKKEAKAGEAADTVEIDPEVEATMAAAQTDIY